MYSSKLIGWAEQMAQLDDQSLKDKTTEFRERLDKGESLDDYYQRLTQ